MTGFSGVNANSEVPTLRENANTVFVRTDNVEVVANRLTIQKTIGGVTYTQIIKKNAALEVIQILPWA